MKSRQMNYKIISIFILPHSRVLQISFNAAKVRTDCDGLHKCSNGLSSNDNLMTGPNIQTDMFDILIRFRTHQSVIFCDMEKMFLQIKIEKFHTDYVDNR